MPYITFVWLCSSQRTNLNIMYYMYLFRYNRGAAKWSPDAEFMKQFSAPVMYPDEVTALWKMPPYNSRPLQDTQSQ